MEIKKDVQLTGASGRPFLLDIYYEKTGAPKPIVLFAHGFKGFKDWGHWHLLARAFAQAGFVFIKFNFSHNGTTLERPAEFDSLEAFGRNNYSKELADLEAVMLWLHSGQDDFPAREAKLEDIYLIGHSRGGAIALIKAAQDERIRALATWASVSRLDYAWQDPKLMKEWEKKGVYHVINGRTGQRMPVYFQMYRDFKAREEQLDVQAAARQLGRPMLVVHGTDDPAVPEAAAQQLKEWHPKARLHLIEGANHVFGGSHPYPSGELPGHARELAEVTINFFREL